MLTKASKVYKPFGYPWAFEAWEAQQTVHWLPKEVPLGDDVQDWNSNLTISEKNLVTQIFRFFTQSDIEVNDCYCRHYMNIFKPTEILMMLTAFANMETIHIAAYSHLLDTIGMPESEYSAFLKYEEMTAKHDFLQSFDPKSPFEVAETLAVYGAFTEGVALFASFAILLNFPRHGKMKGMGQIVTWSVRDESLHVENIIKLFHTWVYEHPEIDREKLNSKIIEHAHAAVKHEDAFINLAFEMGDIEGLAAEEVKQYIRYICDLRLRELQLEPLFNVNVNPLPWLDVMLNAIEHTNFFENRSTEYTKASTEGEWEDVF